MMLAAVMLNHYSLVGPIEVADVAMEKAHEMLMPQSCLMHGHFALADPHGA